MKEQEKNTAKTRSNAINKVGKQITSSRKASLEFLQKVGIVTSKGTLSPKYK